MSRPGLFNTTSQPFGKVEPETLAGVAQWLVHWIINPEVPGLILGPAGNGHCGDLIEDSIQDHSPSTADSSGKAVSRLQSRPRNSLVMAPRRFL